MIAFLAHAEACRAWIKVGGGWGGMLSCGGVRVFGGLHCATPRRQLPPLRCPPLLLLLQAAPHVSAQPSPGQAIVDIMHLERVLERVH